MRFRRVLWTAAFVAVTATLGAQAVPSQLKLNEQEARQQLLDSLTRGGPVLGAAARAFVALPATARVAVVNAGVAWMKTYVNSAPFKTAYAQASENAKPMAPDAQETVDQELKRKQDEQLKDLAESRKMLAIVPAAERPAMEQMLKDMEAQIKSPDTTQMLRMQIELERKDRSAAHADDMKKWQEDYPGNPLVLVARGLQEFLTTSADVDFAAKLVRSPSGQMRFENADYESKSREWKLCFRAGREAVGAARAAATAWLKELPQR